MDTDHMYSNMTKMIVGVNPTEKKIREAPVQNKMYTITATGKPKVHNVTEYAMIFEYENK